MNGKLKVGLSVAGILAILSMTFVAGANYRSFLLHTENTTVHEGEKAKTDRIDSRIELHLAPMEVTVEEMNKKIDRLIQYHEGGK